MSKKNQPDNDANAESTENAAVQTYEDLQVRVEELEKALKTERADAINLRNRADREKAELADYVKVDILKKLLPLVDEVNLAFAHVPEELKKNKWAQGLIGIRKHLNKQLDNLDVEPIKAVGQDFDPETMHAVSMDGYGDQMKVSAEMQAGYRLKNGTTIRPAMVKVEA